MKYRIILFVVVLVACSGCKDYLAVTPDKALTVPMKLEELQALLEQELMFSYSPSATILGADNYYLEYNTWQAWYQYFRNCYIWLPDLDNDIGGNILDWRNLYTIVYISNIVIDRLNVLSVSANDKDRYDFIKGTALFYRAFAFFGLAQVYALPYSKKNADEPGIPLRLAPDLDVNIQRASIVATYQRIIQDLKDAANILPADIKFNHLNWPSQPAVYAALSRVYLSMREYKMAGVYADSCLQLHDALLDYNTIDSRARFPFSQDNPELILQCYINTHASVIDAYSTSKLADTILYQSYMKNDLRKSLYFSRNEKDKPYYSASYSGNIFLFNGFATDEMYLTRAECAVRMGDVNAALRDLNTLLTSKWKKGKYIPYIETNQERLLEIVLSERRKELVFRGLRWTDLRRLNQEERHQITLNRRLNGKTYSLPPGDPRYVYPIPEDEIELTGITQNER